MKKLMLPMLLAFLSVAGCGTPVTKESLQPQFLEACLAGNIQIVTSSLEKFPELANAKDRESNMPPLHRACERGHVEIVKLLLAKGADPKLVAGPYWDFDPLFATFLREHKVEIVKALLDAGANANSKDKSGTTVLMKAAKRGDAATVKLLVEKGADVNAKDGSVLDMSVLHFAVTGNNKDVVEYLIQKGANVNATNKDGETPLKQALAGPSGEATTVKEVIKNAGTQSQTPADRSAVIEVLKKHNAKE
jgi:ankyrin repeat protein